MPISRAIYFDPSRRVKRPSFQFYPSDWQSDAKLRRCTKHLKGVWIDVLCVLHDQEEYGVCRWPLEELAMASFSDDEDVRRLLEMDILRGVEMDTISTSVCHTFSRRHSTKAGETVEILAAQAGPVFYSKRMVVDEYLRWMRGSYGKRSLEHENVPKPKVEMDTISMVPMDPSVGSPSSSSSSSGLRPTQGAPDLSEYADKILAITGQAQFPAMHMQTIIGRVEHGKDPRELVWAARFEAKRLGKNGSRDPISYLLSGPWQAMEGFEKFIATYPEPRKIPDAARAWYSTRQEREEAGGKVLRGLCRHKQSEAWKAGKAIPDPDKWIRNHCWNDEPRKWSDKAQKAAAESPEWRMET